MYLKQEIRFEIIAKITVIHIEITVTVPAIKTGKTVVDKRNFPEMNVINN